MTSHRILVVEDDVAVAAGLVQGLKRAGFSLELATTGAQAVDTLRATAFDLVLLDLSLPERDGLGVLEQFRSRSSAPVIVLTARTGLPDRLKSFELGATDFVAKPFWFEELLARIRAHLRITAQREHQVVTWAGCRVDLDARQVLVDGHEVELTPTEFSVLVALVTNPGTAISRDRLARLASSHGEILGRTIDSHVARIRKKLGEGANAIKTVKAVGYRFDGSS
ncbi:MAG: response regulator transcription factor [Myxococcaceae bacterium]|nr:response regulator transcription factor [Myxococcaceae bacterium]